MSCRKGDPPPPCPYGKKCTYGNKCKFHHPERGGGPHKSVTERLSEHAARHLSARNSDCQNKTVVQGKSLSVPLCSSGETSPVSGCETRKPLSRTRSGVPDCSFTANPIVDPQLQCYMMPPHNITNWDTTACQINEPHGGFPKSHSIENISREAYALTHKNYSPMWSRQHQQLSKQQQQQSSQMVQQQCTNPQETDDSANLHRKLQRQLTLNPAGCDPRIYQLQRVGMGNQQQQQQQQQVPVSQQQSQQQQSRHHSPHRPLAPSLSGARTNHPSQWDLHQVHIILNHYPYGR